MGDQLPAHGVLGGEVLYNVSGAYLEAMREKVRRDSVSGVLTLAGGTQIEVNDENLVSGTLKLTKELCGPQYKIGSFNLSCLRFSFFYDSALGLDLTGASVNMNYMLDTGAVTETVPLGNFLIDPVLSVRRKNILSIVAYDAGVLADAEPSDTLRNMHCTPAELVAAACEECGIVTDIMADSLDDFPNSGVTVTAKDAQIQSCRDIIMWCAALVCGYAVIDRDSVLKIIPAKYGVSGSDSSVIVCDRTVEASERQSVRVTDTRAYIKYLTAYKGDKVANYTSSYVSQDEQASPASYVLEKNPLLCELSEAQCDTVNREWLLFIDSFKQRGIDAVLFGDPALDTGDTLMFRGGDVDQRSGIIGVVTSYEWCYRNYHTVVCSAAECVGSLVSGRSCVSAGTRGQTAKRIDAVKGGGSEGSGVGEWLDAAHTTERFNDYRNDGLYSHTANYSNTAYDHIEGFNNHHTSSYGEGFNHIGGSGNNAFGVKYCRIGGFGNTLGSEEDTAIHQYADVGGRNNRIGGYIESSVINGDGNIVADGCCQSAVFGYGNTGRDIQQVIMGGMYNSVDDDARRSVITGSSNRLHDLVDDVVAGSSNILVNASQDVVCGNGNVVNSTNFSMICGQSNNASNAASAVICGNGVTDASGKYIAAGQVFYVTSSGAVAAAGSYGTIGADYAEMFEWADGNPGGEDRRGMLVAVEGDRIVPANGSGFTGIVSAAPSVVGNAAELYWNGRYMKDTFGAVIRDGSGEPILSPEYDPERKYIPRSERPEWAAVGLVGRLVVRDDGSCCAGDYISAKDGIAKRTSARSRARVLRRIDDSHSEVLIK